jgi:hypothetical protein
MNRASSYEIYCKSGFFWEAITPSLPCALEQHVLHNMCDAGQLLARSSICCEPRRCNQCGCTTDSPLFSSSGYRIYCFSSGWGALVFHLPPLHSLPPENAITSGIRATPGLAQQMSQEKSGRMCRRRGSWVVHEAKREGGAICGVGDDRNVEKLRPNPAELWFRPQMKDPTGDNWHRRGPKKCKGLDSGFVSKD